MTEPAVAPAAREAQAAPSYLRFRIYLTPQRASLACFVLMLVNCVLIAGTWAVVALTRDPAFDWRESPWTRYLLLQLDLAASNVAASWYASINVSKVHHRHPEFIPPAFVDRLQRPRRTAYHQRP